MLFTHYHMPTEMNVYRLIHFTNRHMSTAKLMEIMQVRESTHKISVDDQLKQISILE